MVLIGVLLVGAASAVAADVWLENPDLMVTVQAFGRSWSAHFWALLVVGMAIGFAGLLGLLLTGKGSLRARRVRGERRSVLRERDRLERQVAEERAKRAGADHPAGAAAAAPTAVGGPARATMDSGSGGDTAESARPGLLRRGRTNPVRHRA